MKKLIPSLLIPFILVGCNAGHLEDLSQRPMPQQKSIDYSKLQLKPQVLAKYKAELESNNQLVKEIEKTKESLEENSILQDLLQNQIITLEARASQLPREIEILSFDIENIKKEMNRAASVSIQKLEYADELESLKRELEELLKEKAKLEKKQTKLRSDLNESQNMEASEELEVNLNEAEGSDQDTVNSIVSVFQNWFSNDKSDLSKRELEEDLQLISKELRRVNKLIAEKTDRLEVASSSYASQATLPSEQLELILKETLKEKEASLELLKIQEMEDQVSLSDLRARLKYSLEMSKAFSQILEETPLNVLELERMQFSLALAEGKLNKKQLVRLFILNKLQAIDAPLQAKLSYTHDLLLEATQGTDKAYDELTDGAIISDAKSKVQAISQNIISEFDKKLIRSILSPMSSQIDVLVFLEGELRQGYITNSPKDYYYHLFLKANKLGHGSDYSARTEDVLLSEVYNVEMAAIVSLLRDELILSSDLEKLAQSPLKGFDFKVSPELKQKADEEVEELNYLAPLFILI